MAICAWFQSLDIEPVEEGPNAAFALLAFAAMIILVFDIVMGPELLGQSLFGLPNDIVPNEDLLMY
mgnify:CR=1 FL=1